MANRAFLFCGDSQDPDAWDWFQGGEGPYYSSRWNVPFAWWFFFDPSDIRFVDVSYDGGHWQEAQFVADKQKAFATFTRRKPLLLRLAASEYSPASIIDDFLSRLAVWPGKYLLCDTSGIFDDNAHMIRISGDLDLTDVSADHILTTIGYSYLSYKDKWDFAEKLVGFYTC